MAQQATNTSLRSALGRVRGFGSAKGGTHHWYMQRITSIALLPLTVWFVLSIIFTLSGATYEQAALWVGRPINAVLLLATIVAGFHHTAAGLQVIIEDYANSEWAKLAGILVIKAICWLLALASALAVLRVALQ